MALLWIAVGITVLIGAIIVVRALARVMAAARELQRNVVMLSNHVGNALQHMGADMQALNETVDDLQRRNSAGTVAESAGAGPERTEGA